MQRPGLGNASGPSSSQISSLPELPATSFPAIPNITDSHPFPAFPAKSKYFWNPRNTFRFVHWFSRRTLNADPGSIELAVGASKSTRIPLASEKSASLSTNYVLTDQLVIQIPSTFPNVPLFRYTRIVDWKIVEAEYLKLRSLANYFDSRYSGIFIDSSITFISNGTNFY